MNAPTFHALEFGDFRVDLEERRLFRSDGSEVALTPRVFETLRYLVEHAGRTIDKKAIMEAVWADCLVEENNLAQAISKLRHIFGDTPGSQGYIVTVPGRGYRFAAPVKIANGAAEAGIVDPAIEETKRDQSRPEATISAPTAGWRAGPMIAIALLVAGSAAFLWWRSTMLSPSPIPSSSKPFIAPEKSIAVLPFENLSDDKANAFFVAGVQDEILSNLARIAELKVISRTSANLYKSGNPRNLREIGERLGVAHLLEGSVQRAGDRLRIHVQLIDARTDTHIWAQTYDRNISDIFAIQGEIADAVVRQLQATLTRPEKSALASRQTTNFKAYEACLQGRYFWNKRTPDGFKEAIAHFRTAIELDPAYAPAYVGLADASAFIAAYDGLDRQEATERVRELLQKALALDPTLGEAHASLGLMAMNRDWDWPKAETEFKQAIELNPNYATAHQWYAEFLAYMGRFNEAVAEITRAHQLDPLSAIINTDAGKVAVMARRYDNAVPHYHAALKIDPNFAEAHALLAMTFSFAGKHREAADEMRKVSELENHPAYLSWLAYVHAIAGNQAEARQTIERINQLAQEHYVSPFWMAAAWTALDKDEAFKYFERVFAEHSSGGAVSLKVNPVFDPLRADARFDDLLRRANFSP